MGMKSHTLALSLETADLGVRLLFHEGSLYQSLRRRYADYHSSPKASAVCEVEVDDGPLQGHDPAEPVEIVLRGGRWLMRQGDALELEYDPAARRGRIRRNRNGIESDWFLLLFDSALRFLYSLLLLPAGGFLMHAASAVWRERALIFAGASGAGKTTISRLAPPDAIVLDDEISCLRPVNHLWTAYTTPFGGALGVRSSRKGSPVAGLYLLAHGEQTRLTPLGPASGVQGLLRNVVLFPGDPSVVRAVLNAVCDLVREIPVYRLEFRPEPSVWEMLL